MSSVPNPRFPRIIAQFCRVRLASCFPPRETIRLEAYLTSCFTTGRLPPAAGNGWAWTAIAEQCEIAPDQLKAGRDALYPILAALKKEIERAPRRTPQSQPRIAPDSGRTRSAIIEDFSSPGDISSPRKKRGRKPKPRVEFPEPLWDHWHDPDTFSEALDLHMRRHGDTSWMLSEMLVGPGETLNRTTIAMWRRGSKAPQGAASLQMLERIERRYRLPVGSLKAKLPHPSRSTAGQRLPGLTNAQRRRLAWHLPDDFDRRPRREQEEILAWVQSVVVSGATDYRRYQAAAMKHRYGIRFPNLARLSEASRPECGDDDEGGEVDALPDVDPELTPASVIAPPKLAAELSQLVQFKTATLTTLGYQRNGVWGEETAAQKVEHLGLLFGALAAHPKGPVRGFGAPLRELAFGHLVFPAVWDWYVQWRERRRSFYTRWEVDMLQVAASLARPETGWLLQSPELAQRLRPIRNLVSQADVTAAKADWSAACATMHKHVLARSKEIERVARVHRDPFEPILAVLEAPSPLAEYKKIADEIVRLMPDERLYPLSAAEAVRSYLMIRLGLHSGLRQKNLRQLLVCPRGMAPRTERTLVDQRRGELRWNEREGGWEIFIPSVAFKNSQSSFFGNKPFRLLLPDLAGLYEFIEAYIHRHRLKLLRAAEDPGTFFVKTVKSSSRDAAYDQNTFYEAWRWTIQRYGIHNPYTGRGAIPGLLPHGPHNVRDVLATHILKQTGSYEQASYAIQDTPDVVAQHYGRFLPQDKASLAAQILNRVWDAA